MYKQLVIFISLTVIFVVGVVLYLNPDSLWTIIPHESASVRDVERVEIVIDLLEEALNQDSKAPITLLVESQNESLRTEIAQLQGQSFQTELSVKEVGQDGDAIKALVRYQACGTGYESAPILDEMARGISCGWSKKGTTSVTFRQQEGELVITETNLFDLLYRNNLLPASEQQIVVIVVAVILFNGFLYFLKRKGVLSNLSWKPRRMG